MVKNIKKVKQAVNMTLPLREETQHLINREAGSITNYSRFLNNASNDDQRLIRQWQRAAYRSLCFITRKDMRLLSHFIKDNYTEFLFEQKEHISDFLSAPHKDPILQRLKKKVLTSHHTIEFSDVLKFAEILIRLNSSADQNQEESDAHYARAYMKRCLKAPETIFEKAIGRALRKIEKAHLKTRHIQTLYPH
mgnify:CR=1 FL=1